MATLMDVPRNHVVPVLLTLCSCETVWNEAAFLFLILVSDFGSAAGKQNNHSDFTVILALLVYFLVL